MRKPLITKQRNSSHNNWFILVALFALVIILTYLGHYSLRENSVSVAPGAFSSRVRLLLNFRGIPKGTEGIIQSPYVGTLSMVLVHWFDIPSGTVPKSHIYMMVPTGILEEIAAPIAPLNPFPFWDIIRQQPWYTERLCLGPLFCPGSEHDCNDAAEVFFDTIAPMVHQTPKRFEFNYTGENLLDRRRFLMWMNSQTEYSHVRLYYIALRGHHAFLIEQFGNDFRIYQSRRDSFDLQFWTDPRIPVESMCEPGQSVYQGLLDRHARENLHWVGIRDDKDKIADAKARYGALQNVNRVDILELLRCLAVVLHIDSIRMNTPDHLLNQMYPPMLINNRNTNVWLGKSAICLQKVLNFTHEIVIEVAYVDFKHPQPSQPQRSEAGSSQQHALQSIETTSETPNEEFQQLHLYS